MKIDKKLYFIILFLLVISGCVFNQNIKKEINKEELRKELVECGDYSRLEGCIDNFIDKGYDESICLSLVDSPSYELRCYVSFASRKKDIGPCFNLVDDRYGNINARQTDCITYTAVRLQNPELCEEIVDIGEKDICYSGYVGYSLLSKLGSPEKYVEICNRLSGETKGFTKRECTSLITSVSLTN